MDRKTQRLGEQAVKESIAGRPRRIAHPDKHAPASIGNMRTVAQKTYAKVRAKQNAGRRLSARESNVLRFGQNISTYNDRRVQAFAVGRAIQQARGELKQMPIGKQLRVLVPFESPVGKIYNSKTQRVRHGKNALVIFGRDQRGVFVVSNLVN